jgi:hypothetical protein
MAAKKRKRKKYGKFVVRKGGLLREKFLQKNGRWSGDYKTAKRFSSKDAADRAGAIQGPDYGVFPIGKG